MYVLRRINFGVVAVLGITAGIPKIVRMPPEVAFFETAGLGGNAVVVFGLVQLAGGILLIFRRTRGWGAAVVASGFLGSAVMILSTGQIAFGLVSIVPVLMSGFVFMEGSRRERRVSG